MSDTEINAISDDEDESASIYPIGHPVQDISSLDLEDTIYDDGPGGVAPLNWDESLNSGNGGGSSNLLNFDKLSGPSKQEARNYKCPSCGGEFNNWATAYEVYDRDEDGYEVVSEHRVISSNSKHKIEACPHCNMEKGEYNNE